jgi:H+/Cl- antiporter ClcA
MKKFITFLRTHLKQYFDRIKSEKLKENLLQAIPFWIAAFLTGLIAVLYANLFTWAEQLRNYVLHNMAYFIFVLAPVCFVIAWWVVTKFSPNAKGSGIPQVMAAIELATPKNNHKVDKFLSIRIIIIKIISSLVLVFGGGVIGREGPTIQIAGSIFRKVNRWLPAWWPKISKRNMIMTGAAAGLAAAFNTPLGGIVFAVEELTRTHISYFKTALFTGVIIAGLTAQALLGTYLYLGYPNVTNLSPFVFLGVIVVAILAGLLGSGLSKLILLLNVWKSTFKFTRQHISYILVCGLLIAFFSFFVTPYALGSGKEFMTTILFSSQKYTAWYVPLLRIVDSVLSFTSGAAGGIFAPALSSGAAIGSVIAHWFHYSETNSNLLILSGMVAFLTGVTRTPFTASILVLEMTDRHNVIFQLMLAGMVAGIVSLLVDRHSLYDHLKAQYIEEIEKEKKED